MKIIFIHGAGHTGEIWSELAVHFPGSLTPSLPGHPEGEACETIDAYARWLLESHLSAEGERGVLIGNSMGGAIALCAALIAPQRVAALVLVGSGARLRVHPDFFAQLDQDYTAAARSLAQLQLAPGAPEARLSRIVGVMERSGRTTALRDFRACDAFDVRERLSEIVPPTLVVSGSEDRMTPPKLSALLHERIVGATLESLEGAGHVPQLEQPERLARIISGFLAQVAGGARTGR